MQVYIRRQATHLYSLRQSISFNAAAFVCILATVFSTVVKEGNAGIVELRHSQPSVQLTHKTHDQQITGKEQGNLEKIVPLLLDGEEEVAIVEQVDQARLLMNLAWQEYHNNNFDKALSLFEQSRQMSEGSDFNTIRLGLVYTYLKLDRSEEALGLLEALYKDGYKKEEVYKVLVTTLFSLSQWEKALFYIYANEPALRKPDFQNPREILHLLYPDNNELTTLLAWSALKDKNYSEAEKLFRELIDLFPQNKDFVMSYVFTLGKNGKYREALGFLEALPGLLADNFKQQLASLYVFFVQRAMQEGRGEDVLSYLERAEKNNAATPDLFEMYAWDCFGTGEYLCAKEQFSSLARKFPTNLNYLMGLTASLHALGENQSAINTLEKFTGKLDDKARSLLVSISSETGINLFNAGKFAEAELYLQKGLAGDPDNSDLRETTAWNCYQLGRYECAENSFSSLMEEYPAVGKYVEGLFFSLQKQEKNSEAIALLEQYKTIVSDNVLALLVELYKSEGVRAYEAKDFVLAEKYLDNAVKAGSSDEDILLLFHWTRYYNGQPASLLDYLEQSYVGNSTPETARTLAGLYQEFGMDEKSERLYQEFEKSPNESVRKLAADYYFAEIGPIKAANTYNGADACYEGCAEPRLAITTPVRGRKGVGGESQLVSYGASVAFEIPGKESTLFKIDLHQYQISHGQSSARQYTGQFFQVFQDKSMEEQNVEDTYSVMDLALFWHVEGKASYDVFAGTTPLDGPVAATPVFAVQISSDTWNVKVERLPVKESMLSWIGREDPYSDQVWGRVLQSGISAQYSFSLPAPYWISWNGQYANYDGENTVSNQSFSSSVSAGRTDSVNIFTSAGGLFFKVGGFERNSNFYTFGHGGYYSPKLQISVGPFVKLITSVCETFYLSGNFSLGYSYQETDDAFRYPVSNRESLIVSETARKDLQGIYAGESSSGLNGSVQLEGMLKLGENWLLGGSVGFESSNEYKEYNSLLYLGYSFGKNNFCKKENFSGSLLQQ